jgi:hypothetical protein
MWQEAHRNRSKSEIEDQNILWLITGLKGAVFVSLTILNSNRPIVQEIEKLSDNGSIARFRLPCQ